MNEGKHLYLQKLLFLDRFKCCVIGAFAGAIIMGAVGLFSIRDYSGRLRLAEQNVDRAVRELAETNKRSYELIEDVGAGLGDIKESITDGTRSISSRIREVAKTVEVMEVALDNYRRGGGSIDNNSNSAWGK